MKRHRGHRHAPSGLRLYLRGAEFLLLRLAGAVPSHVARKAIYRARGMQLGKNAWIYSGAEIRSAGRISVGEGSVIGLRATLDGRSGIVIGRHVNFSSETAIWTLQHDPESPSFGAVGAAVEVGDFAWVSFRAIILPGVRIGTGAIVAAGAVVTSDVPEWTIVGGIPAKVIGRRTPAENYTLGKPLPFI